MAQPSSGTYSFQPAFSDLVLEAFARIQLRPSELTADHMWQVRMSANLLLVEWAVRGLPNLWEVELLSIPLVQGVPTYAVPTNVVQILDVYLRQLQMGGPVNLTPTITTTISSTAVSINWPNHGLSAGEYMGFIIPVSVGGLILQQFYLVQSVTDSNNFTIAAATPATASVTGGGAVPVFTSTVNSSTITVVLANHGLGANSPFSVQIPTTVGGVQLMGAYTVATVVNANTFTFQALYFAGSTQTAAENGGLMQVEGQIANALPQDRVIPPISRTEYSAQPSKSQQSEPTTFWWDRTINSTITLWPVPDQNGPYQLSYYAMTQIQDVSLASGQTLDLPYRFFDAFAAGLAYKLGLKFPPPAASGITIADLKAESDRAWELPSTQDQENVPLYIVPALGSFYRY